MSKTNPIFFGIIKDGKLKLNNKNKFDLFIGTLEGQKIKIKINRVKNKRTIRQNSALHLYFIKLAEALNSAGWDMKKTLKESYDIPWTGDNVKNHLWRPIQKAFLNKESTTELTTDEIDKVYDILNKGLEEKTGITIQFPSIESLMDEYENS